MIRYIKPSSKYIPACVDSLKYDGFTPVLKLREWNWAYGYDNTWFKYKQIAASPEWFNTLLRDNHRDDKWRRNFFSKDYYRYLKQSFYHYFGMLFIEKGSVWTSAVPFLLTCTDRETDQLTYIVVPEVMTTVFTSGKISSFYEYCLTNNIPVVHMSYEQLNKEFFTLWIPQYEDEQLEAKQRYYKEALALKTTVPEVKEAEETPTPEYSSDFINLAVETTVVTEDTTWTRMEATII